MPHRPSAIPDQVGASTLQRARRIVLHCPCAHKLCCRIFPHHELSAATPSHGQTHKPVGARLPHGSVPFRSAAAGKAPGAAQLLGICPIKGL